MPLKRIHLFWGLVFIAVFLATGQYMHHAHGHLHGMPDGPRMLYRSGHIYILLAAVLNVFYGYNHSPAGTSRLRILQGLVSAVLLFSPVLLTIGFFYEPSLNGFERPFSRIALYLLFGFGIIAGIAGLRRESAPERTK
jgi:hypothetical protein